MQFFQVAVMSILQYECTCQSPKIWWQTFVLGLRNRLDLLPFWINSRNVFARMKLIFAFKPISNNAFMEKIRKEKYPLSNECPSFIFSVQFIDETSTWIHICKVRNRHSLCNQCYANLTDSGPLLLLWLVRYCCKIAIPVTWVSFFKNIAAICLKQEYKQIEANLMSSKQRVSGELGISQLVTFTTSAKVSRAAKFSLMWPKCCKTFVSL